MEFYETVNRRRSIRQFEDKPIPREALERILDAGLKAPSSHHQTGACCAYGQKRHFGRGEARKALLLPHRRA